MNISIIGLLGFSPGPAELVFIALAIFPLLGIVPFVFFLITLQNTFNAMSLENQKMPPAQVWLSLIPFFGLAWQFVIVIKMSESLEAEMGKRQIKNIDNKPGYGIGLAYCILFATSIIPGLGVLTILAGLVCWIIYWVQINNYRQMLQ